MLDDRNNHVEICLFESFLAKFFIEHPHFFKAITTKIVTCIEEIITLNAGHSRFERMLFTVFSMVYEKDKSITDLESLKHSQSLIAVDTFLKYFIEQAMTVPGIKRPSLTLDVKKEVPSLKSLAYLTLFKSPEVGQMVFFERMRPKSLFLEKNRGVVDVDVLEDGPTRNFGILSGKDTPKELANYFAFEQVPSRAHYLPREDSLMARWLRAHHLPVISGASGGIGKTVSTLAACLELSTDELRLLGIMVASSTIALGHHSFFEVLRPLSFILNPLEEQTNLRDFYEQCIPEVIKISPSYQEHMRSFCGANLIEAFCFESPLVAESKPGFVEH